MSSLTRPNRASNTAQHHPVNKRNNFSIKSLKCEYNNRFNAFLYFHIYIQRYPTSRLDCLVFYLDVKYGVILFVFMDSCTF